MNEVNQARLKFVIVLFLILSALVFIPLPFYFLHVFNYFGTMPLIIFISAFFVFFTGAWWDFGARNYVGTLMAQKIALTEERVRAIHRQQLILTLIFLIIGSFYILVSLVIQAIGS
ncbi:MAG: hypothetical protein M1306_02985 [Candidatus Thermoplasmatota archaeon]|jgi:hypothetical protein|nr:hypothetical protein [Candidatus Thermoplasmatota archaeon]